MADAPMTEIQRRVGHPLGFDFQRVRFLTLFFHCLTRMLSGRGGEASSLRESRCARPY
jgi:hypothetical protein